VQFAKRFDELARAPSTGCDEMKRCDVSSFGVQGRVTVVLLGSSDCYTVVAFSYRLRSARDTVEVL
jgi:hypothetical protein